MRAAFLWSHLSGYLNSSLKSLVSSGHEVFISSFSQKSDAPFSLTQFSWVQTNRDLKWDGGNIDFKKLLFRLNEFQPEIIFISGWNHVAYKRVAKAFKGSIPVVLCMDNQWLETPKQWLGRLVSRWYIQKYFDHAFVAGERQVQFAHRLGFSVRDVSTGLYSCDFDAFSKIEIGATATGFLYLGRLAPEKGISTLLEAYNIYCQRNERPWPLTIVGTGSLQHIIDALPNKNVKYLNFVQPEYLPALLGQNSCLVAPSLFEPWGVQIHEATSAGMFVICTSICGSAVHLVRDGYNGKIVPPNDSRALVKALEYAAKFIPKNNIPPKSKGLASQLTPRLWALQVESIFEKEMAKLNARSS